MKTTIGFIGGGRVTRIILQALENKNYGTGSVTVFDTNAEVLKALKESYPSITLADTAEDAAGEGIVFIALHPPAIADTLAKIKGSVAADATVVSLAPKVSIEKLSAMLGVDRVVRLIPNATSYINQGYNPVTFADSLSVQDKGMVMELLEILGHTFEVPEAKLESYAILSAMLPTYFWFQWKELVAIGNEIGLTESEGQQAIQETLTAAMNLMFQSGLTPDQVIDLIPVKPLAEHEEQIAECFRSKLIPLFEKIKP